MLKVLMVVYSYYPSDSRVRREAEALARDGMSVDVICLKKGREHAFEQHGGVSVYRLAVSRSRSHKFNYVLEYGLFMLYAFVKVSLLYLKKRYDIVHVHNMPDLLVFTGLLGRLLGAKIVLDLHDPMPEVYLAKYKIKSSHPVIRILRYLEKICISFADMVLTTNISFRELFISRGCPADKIHIVMNSPQEDIFLGDDGNIEKETESCRAGFTIMYHGTIVERNGLDTALKAVALIKNSVQNIRFLIFGDGDFVDEIREIIRINKLEDIVKYSGHVQIEQIVKAIKEADLGLIPNKRNSFTELNFPTRIFEYLCLGKPVVVPRTRGIKDYFDEKSIFYFEPSSHDDLAQVILNIYYEKVNVKEVLEKGFNSYKIHSWIIEKERYLDLMRSCSGKTN